MLVQTKHAIEGSRARVGEWVRTSGRLGAVALALWMGALGMSVASAGAEPFDLKLPLGLDKRQVVIPEDNPITREKIALGRLLFFDKRLSKNNTIACASCHMPQLAFTDGQPVSTGIHALQGGRSAPTAINRLFSSAQFWDGRAATLEDQSVGPFVSPVEHGFANHDELVAKLNQFPGYRQLFLDVFGTGITTDRIGQAIATFQRTLLSGNSPYDRHNAGDTTALSASAKRGLELFRGRALCFTCHSGANFTDEKFHNLGVDWDGGSVDVGRYAVTNKAADIGAFKTPTLREIANTAPYMHDGRFATLRGVVDFYARGGFANPHKDPLMQPLKLSVSDKDDLVAFLRALSGEGWEVTAPTVFPE